MKYFVSGLCMLVLSVMAISCGEELTDLIFGDEKLEIPDKALFIGNSLLLGNGTFGMNATDSASDYHALIQKRFLKDNPAYTDVRLSGTGFEACENQTQQAAWLESTLRPCLSDDLDLVVIQIGDNVNTSSKKSAFQQGAKELIATIKEGAPRARIVWIYGWYVSSSVIASVENACSQYAVSLVAIDDINRTGNCSSIGTVVTRTAPTTQTLKYTRYTVLSENCLQIDFTLGGRTYQATVNVTGYSDDAATSTLTWQGYETITTDEGIASHPGNSGFEQIARRFFEVLQVE